MTIVKNSAAYRTHEIGLVSPAWRARLEAVAADFRGDLYIRHSHRTVVALECMLQITGDDVAAEPSDSVIEEKLTLLLGAIHSPRFIDRLSPVSTQAWATTILGLINRLRADQRKPPLRMSLGVRLDAQIIELVKKFECVQLDDEAIWVWSAWPVRNHAGKMHFLPLYPFYQRLGRPFTERLYAACDDFISASRGDTVPGIPELGSFLKSREDITLATLEAPHAGEKFWRDFWEFYQANSACSEKQMMIKWCARFRRFAHEVLIGPGLFPSMYSRFPGPDSDSCASAAPEDRASMTRKSGNKEGRRILFDIPPDLNGAEIWSYLETTCPATLESVKKWAESASSDSWNRHRQRKRLAHGGSGQIREGRPSRANAGNMRPNLSVHAERYEREGHPYSPAKPGEKRVWVKAKYRDSRRETARALGLPTAGTLFPYAAMLVLEHPSITGSFLDSLELWDDNNRLIGLVKQTGVWYLIGIKWRAGERVGEQRVPLTSKTLRVVWKIISITSHLRKWLRDRDDPSWKLLFLECGQGFDIPKRVFFSRPLDAPCAKKDAENRFVLCGGMTQSDARKFVARLTIAAIRKTTGINIFLITKNPYIASKALGHDEYQPELFSCYVPPQINALAYELIVRNLQTSLVAKSLEKSPFLLGATGFNSSHELKEFLEHNPFPEINSLSDSIKEQNQQVIRTAKRCQSEIIFSVSLETLIPVTSAVAAAKDSSISMSTEGAQIASFACAIVGMLDARTGIEPSIDAIVKEAKARANVDIVREALRA